MTGAPQMGLAAPSSPARLNLGCGHDVRQGWVNLDIAPLPGVDVVHDLDQLPLPFEDAVFDEIDCKDVLEHVELVPVMRELHRILAPGASLRIAVPHFTSNNFYIDPTHRKAFSAFTFEFFVRESAFDRDYYFDFHFSRLEDVRITFGRRLQPWNWAMEKLANVNSFTQRGYEATFASRLFPAINVEATLVK